MKLVFFAFKHRYRYKDLNNFLKTRLYGKYFLLNLSGPFKHIIARLLMKFSLGFAISCDAKPLIKKKKIGINFFIRGTNHSIPPKFRNLKNNFVSIKNPFKKDKNIFQIYPLDIKENPISKDKKIIYISGAKINLNEKEKFLWNKNKRFIFKNFSLLDKKKFWIRILKNKNSDNFFNYYKKFKLLLRLEIVSHLQKKYDEKFILIGDDWKDHLFKAKPSNFNLKQIKKLYAGNICLDLGSIEGSSSLYTRSNQIIESGGLILQSEQSDYQNIWGGLSHKMIFNNFKKLDFLVNKLLKDNSLCNSLIRDISQNFLKNKKYMEKSLDKLTKKT